MKTNRLHLIDVSSVILLSLVLVVLNPLSPEHLSAQTFTILHGFTGDDGSAPAGLILSTDTLYGTSLYGGSSSNGTVYAVKTDGSGFRSLYNFSSVSGFANSNPDGAQPQAPLVISGDTLYGTTSSGGNSGYGTVFKISTDGSGFAVLHHFAGPANNDGAFPYAGLTISGNMLFGTTSDHNMADGTIFSIKTDGTGYKLLHQFAPSSTLPQAPLVISGNTIFGSAVNLFKINTDGTGFQILHPFSFIAEGFGLYAGLTVSGNRLFGADGLGGNNNDGILFALDQDGGNFQILHGFTAMITNYDGAGPQTDLIPFGNNKLFGAARTGGWGWGALFRINTDGSDYQTIYNFSQGFYDTPDGGAFPAQKMIFTGNAFYGTTLEGGPSGNGIVFSFSLPQISLQPALAASGQNIVIKWPTNMLGLTLQSCSNLESQVWTSVSAGVLTQGGQNTVTNSVSVTHQFFRLSP